MSTKERALWANVQAFYEGISRAQRIPIVGPWIWRAYDRLQAISPYYPVRDLSKPSLGPTRLHSLIRRGFGASVVTCTREREDLPILSTFYAIALAADYAGRREVFCVVADSDINRVWVANDPKKSRVNYLAPTALSRVHLLEYGVAAIVMSLPLGAHDERNQMALMSTGAGYRQEDPRAAVEWLSDWIQNGLLAIGAFNG